MVDISAVRDLHNLTYIRIDGTGLDSLPESFATLVNLTHAVLNDNLGLKNLEVLGKLKFTNFDDGFIDTLEWYKKYYKIK